MNCWRFDRFLGEAQPAGPIAPRVPTIKKNGLILFQKSSHYFGPILPSHSVNYPAISMTSSGKFFVVDFQVCMAKSAGL